MKYLIIIMLLIANSNIKAQIIDSLQTNNPGDTINQANISTEDNIPEFPGGTSNLYKFIADNIQYPKLAYENGVEGTVFVKFKIDKNLIK